MLPEFSSIAPRTRQEAVESLGRLEDAAVLAGGTDLLVRMKRGETHRHIIDVSRITELMRLTEEDWDESFLRVGAGLTHASLCTDPLVDQCARSLFVAAGLIGSPQIRNAGTIGGNLVNASPAADSIAPLLIHNARLVLESTEGERFEDLERFIVAPYKTTIGQKELLTSIVVESLKGYEEGYRRVAKRAGWAISRLSVAWAIHHSHGRFEDVRLAIGSCTPIPFRARAVEAFLRGQKREKTVTGEAVRLVLEEIRRITGERPSFVYKLPVLRDLLVSIFGG